MIIRIIGIAVVLIGILFALGPRVEIDTTIHPLQLAADLDTYLAESEVQFTDLKAQTGKTIVWTNPEIKDETPVSFVYLHGFSATRQDYAPMSDLIAEQLGGNLYYARLTGHGRSDDAMGEATVNAWINDTAEAVAIGEAIGEEVVLMANSTGATLVAWMAANGHLSEDVRALILMSPNFGPANAASEFLLWPWGKQIAELVEGRYRSWRPLNDRHAQFWTYRYPSAALLPMMGTVKIARESNLASVKQPLLMLYSKQDIIVNQEEIQESFAAFGSEPKELLTVTTEHKWGHVLAGDILSPGTTEPLAQTIVEFLIPVLDAPE